MTRRSLLFSPGDEPELMRKAPGSGADVVCFDLEDAVAPTAKGEARAAVRDVLTDPAFDPDAEVCVRLTGSEVAADLDALTAGGIGGELRLDAVMLPKVESAKRVRDVRALCREHDLDPAVFALVETAAGILRAEDVAAADPTSALLFGAEDLAADVGATRTEEGTEVLHAREHVVLATAAAGVDAIDTVFTDFSDAEGLADDAAFAVELGYDGKMAIHPTQVGPINDAFTPEPERVEWAERVLDAREAASGDEEKAVFEVDGEMIDAPLIAQAEQVIARAEAAGIREE
ncbi:HpcH/HpaI aldolase/citrate lyase family protein [Haloparvum sp. AD34]